MIPVGELKVGSMYQNHSSDINLKFTEVESGIDIDYVSVYCDPIEVVEKWLLNLEFWNDNSPNVFCKRYGELYKKGTIIFTIDTNRKTVQVSVCSGGENSNYIYLKMPEHMHVLQNLIDSIIKLQDR